jgi:preprotein translocase subunit SecG
MSFDFILLVHVIIAVAIIGLVLIQHGKGAEAGAAFGGVGGASGTIFGSQGHGSFLTKATTLMAILLACTSLSLTLMLRGNNVASKVQVLEQQETRTIPVEIEANTNSDKKVD